MLCAVGTVCEYEGPLKVLFPNPFGNPWDFFQILRLHNVLLDSIGLPLSVFVKKTRLRFLEVRFSGGFDPWFRPNI